MSESSDRMRFEDGGGNTAQGYCLIRDEALRALEVRLLHMVDRAKYYFEYHQALPLLQELQDLTSAVRKSADE